MAVLQAKRIKVPKQINIVQPPNKINYTYGEQFDPTGLITEIVYEDNSTERVSSFQWMNDEMPRVYNESTVNLGLYQQGTRFSTTLPTSGELTSMFAYGNLASTDTCYGIKNGVQYPGVWSQHIAPNPAFVVPPDFKQYTWLSNGSGNSSPAYIKTNYFHGNSTWIRFRFKWNMVRSYNTIYGAGYADNSSQCFTIGNQGNGYWNIDMHTIGYYNGNIGPTTAMNTETLYDCKFAWNQYTINDYHNQFSQATPTSGTAQYEDFIFGRNLRGSYETGEYGSMTLYELWIYEGAFLDEANSTLKRHFVPAQTTTTHDAYQGSTKTTCAAGTNGLYETEEERFYISNNAQTFTIGEEIQPLITRNGFMISNLDYYGPWDAYATNGTKEATGETYIDATGFALVNLQYEE